MLSIRLMSFFLSISMTSCFAVLLLRRWNSLHDLQRNSQQSVQNATAGLLSTQLLQLISDSLVICAWYPAISTLKLRRRFRGKSLTPTFESETLFVQILHCIVSWEPAFSASFSRHVRQNECRHGSIRGSVYDSEQSSQITVSETSWFSVGLDAMIVGVYGVQTDIQRRNSQVIYGMAAKLYSRACCTTRTHAAKLILKEGRGENSVCIYVHGETRWGTHRCR